MKIVQCEGCGRIRLHRAWAWADFVQPDVIGLCPGCVASRRAADEEKLLREARRTERRAATGTLTCRLPADPFDGFRGE